MRVEVPVWEKINLTLPEAAELFSIGKDQLREMTNDPSCNFVLFKGTHRLIKRKKLEEYLEGITTL